MGTIFLITAIFCLGSSATYHWFCCVGRHTSQWLCICDHASISALIAGSTFPVVHYSLFCHPIASFAYLATTTLMGSGTLLLAFKSVRQVGTFQLTISLYFIIISVFSLSLSLSLSFSFSSFTYS